MEHRIALKIQLLTITPARHVAIFSLQGEKIGWSSSLVALDGVVWIVLGFDVLHFVFVEEVGFE
jgi:hypothetical protein